MAEVTIVIKDTENNLFDIEVKGLNSTPPHSPAIVAGHATVGILRYKQKEIHEIFLSKLLDTLTD